MTAIPRSTTFVADQELIGELAKISRPATMGPDRVLFRQGAPAHGLFIIKSGSAKLTLKSGRKIILQILVSADSLLGVPAVVGSHPYSLTAAALRGAEVAYIPREDFSRLIAAAPHLMLKVVALLAGEVRSARQRISQIDRTPTRRSPLRPSSRPDQTS
jgi:CRP-like cAMP-binding protein